MGVIWKARSDSSAIQNTVIAPTMESASPSQPCSAEDAELYVVRQQRHPERAPMLRSADSSQPRSAMLMADDCSGTAAPCKTRGRRPRCESTSHSQPCREVRVVGHCEAQACCTSKRTR